MKVVGIISEFNPFHKGHKYLLDNVRADLKPDAIVCVMSGDFMQRGVPSLWNKYTRAQMAMKAGVDLVIELPAKYAVNAAPEFAKGGIGVLKKMNCIDYVAFGSECGSLEDLQKAMNVERQKGFSERLEMNLEKGMSYPKAYALACENPLFETPNNTLSIEYLRELKRQKSEIVPFTVKRFFGISAETIRQDIIDGKISKYSYPSVDWTYKSDERLFAMVRYALLTKSEEELRDVFEMSEGLENRLKDVVLEAKDLNDLILKTKSKRFTYAKVSRILLQMLLGINKSNAKKVPDTVKILGLNKNGRKVLKLAGKEGTLKFEVSEFDAHVHDIYNVLTGKELYDNSDYVINVKPTEK